MVSFRVAFVTISSPATGSSSTRFMLVGSSLTSAAAEIGAAAARMETIAMAIKYLGILFRIIVVNLLSRTDPLDGGSDLLPSCGLKIKISFEYKLNAGPDRRHLGPACPAPGELWRDVLNREGRSPRALGAGPGVDSICIFYKSIYMVPNTAALSFPPASFRWA